MRNSSSKILLTLLLGIFLISFTSAIDITRLAPTTDIFITNESTVNLSYSIHAPDGVSSITQSINGTNFTLYDYTLVGFWNFDNRSELGENDTFVRDLSMYGNNGTVVGGENITWGSTFGKYGGAFNFSGKKNSINTTLNNLNTSLFTMSAWVNTKGSSGTTDIIRSSATVVQAMTLISTNRVTYLIRDSNSQLTTLNVDLGDAINNNQWYFITCTFDGTTMRIYINGVLKKYTNPTITGNLITTSTFKIGSIGDISGEYFNGSIDDVMIWNKSLSQEEINYLYNSQITKFNSTYIKYNTTTNNSAILVNSFLCTENSTAHNFCTSTSTFRELETIKSNFSTSKGSINNIFYGVNTHGDYLSNSEVFNQNMFIDSKITLIRGDMAFNSYSISEGTYNTTKIITYSNLVNFARLNNYKIIWTASEMPNWLANQTSGWCNVSNQLNANITCPPNNYSKWGDLVKGFLIDIGCDSNICMVEVWNEPNTQQYFLNNLSQYDITNSTIRLIEYNKLYNATYLAVKSIDSNYKVGGATTTQSNLGTSIIVSNWMSNFSNQIDFISHHNFLGQGSFTKYHDALLSDYNWIYNNITAYSVNTSLVFIDEYNVYDDTTKLVFTNNWTQQLAQAYEVTLNNYPDNVSLVQYQFARIGGELNNNFHMINTSNNYIFPSYNVTKNFAHLCPSGATVSVTSNDDDTIKQVACKKDNQYSLIIINTDGTNSKNYTIDLAGLYPYKTILDYETNEKFKLNGDNASENHLIEPYGIDYYYSGSEVGATLRGLFKLNEYSGNVLYDSRNNLTNGLKSGASWVTDGILNKIPTSKYTINLNSGLTSLSNDYLYEYLTVSYNTVADKTSLNALTSIENSGSTVVNFLPLVFLAIIFGAILFLVLRFLIPYIELGQNINKF